MGLTFWTVEVLVGVLSASLTSEHANKAKIKEANAAEARKQLLEALEASWTMRGAVYVVYEIAQQMHSSAMPGFFKT